MSFIFRKFLTKMSCFWSTVSFLLLSIQYTQSVVQSDFVLKWNSLKKNHARMYSLLGNAPDNPINTQEYSSRMIQANKFGLPKCASQPNGCQKIGIVGAGTAGLYCGILLAESGHRITIYEASDRAGGRVFTYRDPRDPSKYTGELGAMRFPLAVHPYVNSLIDRYNLSLTEFDIENDNTTVYINGIFTTRRGVMENPDILQFNTSESERGKTPDELAAIALLPLLVSLEQNGWESFRKQWDSYSIESYLNEINMSRGAIDYFSIFQNVETDLTVALVESVRSIVMLSSAPQLYKIIGGSDMLIRSMVNECQKIKGNRCSIVYLSPVTQIQVANSKQIRLRTKNGKEEKFDTVVVAITATAAQLINFQPRLNFVDKYRTMRQLHYKCATKILLSFNVSWWYTQEHIDGGQAITDLNIRIVYYPRIINNRTDGGTMLVAYTYSQDALVWQSQSDSDAINLALDQLIQLHRSSPNIRDFFQGGKVQRWCGDPYSHGAFATFLPFQETNLYDPLQASVSNVHFIGEHTTLIHGWVEGALSSAIRGATAIAEQS